MKTLFVACSILFCSISLHGQKTRFGQELPYAKPGVAYPLAVHVYGLHVRPDLQDWKAGYSVNVVFADVVTNQRKLELRCTSGIPEKPYTASPLSLGDFSARVLKGRSGLGLGDDYELLLPKKKVLGCVVAGMSE